jgi:subtilisin family serine protease
MASGLISRARLTVAGTLVLVGLAWGVPVAVTAATTTTSTTSTTSTLPPVFAPGNSPAAGSKRYIIRYADDVTEADKDREIENRNGNTKQRLSKVFNGAIADLSPAQAALLRKSTKVLWVEEDKGVKTQAILPTPDANMWGLDRIDETTLPLDGQYEYATNGSGVTAYVVDTGILPGHTQFTGRVLSAFFDAFGGTGADCNGHGTHVAGTIAGSSLGVAPAASLVAVRVLDCNGSGSVSGVIAGIDWAINHHTTAPAVMNLSLGTTKSDSLNSAIDRAYADGITVVVAAGNSNVDACTVSPGSNKVSALTVGATTNTDARASYSNFGACLDLFAPGSGIKSAWHTGTSATNVLSGTSMASPHVAGIAARYLSAVPAASPATVMSAVISATTNNVVTSPGTLSPNKLAYASPSAVPTGSGTSTTVPGSTTLPPGSGTEAAPSVPGLTSTPVALAGALSAWLEWTAASTGGSPITGHVVRVYRSGQLLTQVVVDADSYHTITKLRAGSSHSFTVAAMNGVGVGPFSARSNTIIPLKNTGTYTKSQSATADNVVPDAPTKLSVARSGSHVVVLWTPPSNAVASSHEVLFYQNKKVVAKVVTVSSGGVRIYGLKKGTYAVRVRAANTAGFSVVTPHRVLRIR